MIRIRLPAGALEKVTGPKDPSKPNASWAAAAGRRILQLAKGKKWDDGATIWSELRSFYRQLQHDKCAFCERALTKGPAGGTEHAVEHYRPKGRTKVWPTPKMLKAQPARKSLVCKSGQAMGYWWLAYHPWNYVTACSTCNTGLKKDFFPIDKTPATAPSSAVLKQVAADLFGTAAKAEFARLRKEGPLLPFPLGTIDEHDPEELFQWRDGVVAIPAAASGRKHQRASTTIAFFDLDGRDRGDLLEARAVMIRLLFYDLEATSKDRAAKRNVDAYVSTTARYFTAVARAFIKLHAKDRNAAKKVRDAAQKYITSVPPP